MDVSAFVWSFNSFPTTPTVPTDLKFKINNDTDHRQITKSSFSLEDRVQRGVPGEGLPPHQLQHHQVHN